MRKFKLSVNSPLPNRYYQEIEQSDELIPELSAHYTQLIEILCWAVELGDIYIFKEVVVMSQY